MSRTHQILLTEVNDIRSFKGLPSLSTLDLSAELRAGFGFDSLDLAELAVRLEQVTGRDVFAGSLPSSVGDLADRIRS